VKKRLDKPENPDIEFTADVKARELRFDEVPDTEVHPPAQTERENLPEKVQPVHAGITFRDVSVKVRIANELTVSKPRPGEESRGEQTASFMRDHDSDNPSRVAGRKKPETGKER
jgi:hypothetical protein